MSDSSSDLAPRHIHRLGPADARDLSREVLLPDGLGGFALGSPAGVPTRSYSGLSVSHRPPGERRVMFVSALEQLRVGEQRCDLHAFEVAPGSLEGEGLSVLSGVTLRDLLPEREQVALGMRITRRSVVPRHSGALVLLYDIEAPHLRSGEVASLSLGAVLVDRDMHQVQLQTPELSFECLGHEVRVYGQDRAHGEAFQTRLRLHAGQLPVTPLAVRPHPQRLHYRLDAEHGRPSTDRAVRAELWEIKLHPGLNRLALVIEGSESGVDDPWQAEQDEAARRAGLVDQAWSSSGVRDEVVATLSLAADAFLVRRESTASTSVIAGYPWFADWGRDSLLALSGLTLSTGRTDDGLSIAETFMASLRGGLTPNNFHDDGQGADYNTVDGSLWLAFALEKLVERTGNAGLARRALTSVRGVLRDYARGTDFGIGMDNADGLLLSGKPGVQLTWMDVKIHDWVVTPRHGKPVEIAGLWLAALGAESRLSASLGEPAEFAGVLRAAKQAFGQFWHPQNRYLYDVLRASSSGNTTLSAPPPNAQIRPNALLALALPDTPATPEQVQGALDVAARDLLTPLGLRTLSPGDPEYLDHYGGPQLQRDAAYHQGTIWPWLLGPYADLLLRGGQVAEARAALSGILGHLWEAGLGSVSEVFSPDTSQPGGCAFQAWSVAEVLRSHINVSLAERQSRLVEGRLVQGHPASASPQPDLGGAEAPVPTQPTSPRSRAAARGKAAAPPQSGPSELIGGTSFGTSGMGVGASLLNMTALSGPPSLPLGIPEPVPTPTPPRPRRAEAAAPATPAPSAAPTPEPNDSPLADLLGLDLVLPNLTSFNLPVVPLATEAPLRSTSVPNPPLSVEDPDVIEPLT